MNFPRLTIQNRLSAEPDAGWIHIVPKGDLPNHSAGIVQVLDDVSLRSIMAGIESDKASQGAKWPGIYGTCQRI